VADLYLIFFAVGALIFTAIVIYSVLQKRQFKPTDKKDYVDPLFAELEQNKNKATTSNEAAAKAQVRAEPRAEPKIENKAHSEKTEPEMRAADVEMAKTVTESTSAHSALSAAKVNSPERQSTQGRVNTELRVEEQRDKSDRVKQAPSLDRDDIGSSAGTAKSATIHKADLAPKPKLDKESASVVTELVARIKNPDPIEQQGLLSLFRKHDFKFHRKVHIYGLNQLTDMWRDIEFELPSARFTELGVSIQLADREGAMSQRELHDFQQMVLEFTNAYDAPFEFSMEIDEALKQALALDQIGRRYDSMAVLNVVPKAKAGFRMADIESCARDLMMSTDKNGIFMKTVGSKNNISVLFRLACTDGSGQFGISSGTTTPVHDLVVYMNVPATKDPEMVFQEMVKDANSLATWLEGKVVDRNGRIMTQRSYSMLMQQVSDIAFSMQQDGFIPGDAVAKKLF
jgi:FtsZ-interacting cell division protein ZipA